MELVQIYRITENRAMKSKSKQKVEEGGQKKGIKEEWEKRGVRWNSIGECGIG